MRCMRKTHKQTLGAEEWTVGKLDTWANSRFELKLLETSPENMEVQEARAPPSLWARPAPAGPAPIMKIAPRISRSDPTDGPGQYNIWSDKLSRSYSTLCHLRSCGNICRNYFQCGWPLAPNPQLWTCFWCVAKEVVFRSGKKKRTAWLFLPPRITLVTKFYVFATGLKVGQEGYRVSC